MSASGPEVDLGEPLMTTSYCQPDDSHFVSLATSIYQLDKLWAQLLPVASAMPRESYAEDKVGAAAGGGGGPFVVLLVWGRVLQATWSSWAQSLSGEQVGLVRLTWRRWESPGLLLQSSTGADRSGVDFSSAII